MNLEYTIKMCSKLCCSSSNFQIFQIFIYIGPKAHDVEGIFHVQYACYYTIFSLSQTLIKAARSRCLVFSLKTACVQSCLLNPKTASNPKLHTSILIRSDHH